MVEVARTTNLIRPTGTHSCAAGRADDISAIFHLFRKDRVTFCTSKRMSDKWHL